MYKILPIKERILRFIDLKGIKKIDFCEITGISYANLKGKSLYSEIGGDKIAEILSIYSDLNAEWLVTGKGSMLKNEKEDDAGCAVDVNDQLIRDLIEKNGELRQQLGEQIKENEIFRAQIEKLKRGPT